MKRPGKGQLVAFFLALLVVASGVAVAASTNTALASEHTTTEDFDNAQTLDGFTTVGDELSLATDSTFTEQITNRYLYEQNLDGEYGGTMEDGTSAGYTTDAYQGSYAKLFDGSNDYLRTGNDPDGSRTYATWVYPNSGATGSDQVNVIGAWGSVVTSDLAVWYDGSKLMYRHYTGSTASEVNGADWTAGEWTHVAIVYDAGAGEIRGYRDGNLVGTTSVGTPADGAGIYYGGTSASGGDFVLDGALDDSRVYYDALTDQEVAGIAGGSGGADLPATYVSDWHTVEGATTAKINLTEVNSLTVDATVKDSNGNVLGTGSYTSPGEKTIQLSGQTSNDISVNLTAHSSTAEDFGVTIASEGITFENTAPTVDNSTASPEGTLNLQNPEFTIDVGDQDFDTAQGDTVNASLYVGGQYAGMDTVTSNGTATVTAEVTGRTTYHWEIEDSYGGTATSETYDITTPENLYVFEETGSHDLITGVNITATVTSTDGETVDLVADSDGTLSLANLPTESDYVFTLSAEGYHTREVYINDLFDQASVYMLNKSEPNIENTISVTDQTGRYGDGTIILVERVINTTTIEEIPDNGPQWVTIGGDRLGTSGFYTVNLEQFGRYRFVVRNVDGDSRVLGEYTAKVGGNVDLKIGTVSYSLGDVNTYEWDTSIENTTDGNYSLSWAYNDHKGVTDWVNVKFEERESGDVIDSYNFTNGPYGEVTYSTPITSAMVDNTTYVVNWTASRNGELEHATRLVSGNEPLDFPISDLWRNIAFGGIVLLLAFFVGAGAGAAPALVTVGLMAGLGVYIGLAPPALGFGSVALVLGFGAIYVARSNSPRV